MMKYIAPVLLLGTLTAEAQRHFPQPQKKQQAIIRDIAVRPTNGGINPAFKGYVIKGRILLGSNPCVARGVKAHVKQVQRRRAVRVIAFKKLPGDFRRRICTKEYRPVYKDFKIKVVSRKKVIINHVDRKGNHVPAHKLVRAIAPRPLPILPTPRPIIPRPRPILPRPVPAPAPILPAPLPTQDITLGQPGYGGNGCPQGTASATLSPDKKSLSIIFDEYMAEAGGDTGKRIARKSCNVAIPVHVPQGFSVSIFKIDYRGYISTPEAGDARLNVRYFFAGQRGLVFNKKFGELFDDEYTLSNEITAGALVFSNCGADVNLRVNSSLLVKSNLDEEEALGTVDSADVNAGLKFHLQWKRCNQ